ncbi:hypothetical protein [Nocardia sp. NPDC004722]
MPEPTRPIHPGDWYCQGLGEPPAASGGWCFVAAPYTRTCADLTECRAAMAGARSASYRRVSELAAAGDPDWAAVARQLARPDQFHGGPDSGDPADPDR